MAVYVITGGAGFIGSSIVARLVSDAEEVRVVDDFSSGHRRNLEGLSGRAALFEGDICDGDLLREAFAGADFVLHQAAVASVQQSTEDPLGTNRVNVEGTLNVLAAARECGVKRVVYASSCAVYGDSPEMPGSPGRPTALREDMTPVPKSPYAVGKLAGEHYCRVFGEVLGLQALSLRYFNVYGPRQDPCSHYAGVIPTFIRCIMEGRRPTVFGDGAQSRDFVFVEDVVEANLQAARAARASGGVYNVGSGKGHTVNELLEALLQLMGQSVAPEYLDARPGDMKHALADTRKAREAIGYEARVKFREGLRRTVEWYRENAAAIFLSNA